MENYFRSWKPADKPAKKKASFVPSEVIQGKSIASPAKSAKTTAASTKKSKSATATVLPRDLKVRYGTDRLVDIRSELVKLKRKDFPNAGAVLLRVFFELAVTHYLERTGSMQALIEKLGGKGKLPFGVPTMRQMVPAITKIAKDELDPSDANKVEKALKYDASAPFSLSELHAFIHQAGDLPSDRDIWQFWLRTEPLFRLMLEADDEEELS